MNIFGNITCPHCQLETRFMMEDEQSEKLYLLGDSILSDEEMLTTKTECDYCQSLFDVYMLIVEQTLSMFVNEKEYEDIQSGKKIVRKAKHNEGLEREKSQQLKQFHETFTSDFSLHPKKQGNVLLVKGKKWVIGSVWKKEQTEKDTEKRLTMPLEEEYWYEVTSQKDPDEKKWIVIAEAEENNGLLLQEAPVVKTGEEIYDITDGLHKTALLFTKELSNNFILRAYDLLSGVRIQVYSQGEEGTEELEMDVLGDNAEDALAQIEDIFSVID